MKVQRTMFCHGVWQVWVSVVDKNNNIACPVCGRRFVFVGRHLAPVAVDNVMDGAGYRIDIEASAERDHAKTELGRSA